MIYNLYARRGFGGLAGHSNTLEVQQLPVYKEVMDILAKPDFMPEGKCLAAPLTKLLLTEPGGWLSKHCTHAYAHATKEGASALSSVFKGSEMIAYEVFRSLGVGVLVRPVIEHLSRWMDEEYIEGDLATHNHVGKTLAATKNTSVTWDEGEEITEAFYDYPHELMKVIWMNEPFDDEKNMQFTFVAVSFIT